MPPRLRLTLAVFAASALALYLLTANRFYLSNDEGIFVDGSLRVLAGQAPYRDFFILMGPGSFWLQALVMKIVGTSFSASHLVNIFDASLMAACICWLVSRRARFSYAAWTAAAFVLLSMTEPVAAQPTHRWDSAAFATLAITLLADSPGLWSAIAAGCAIAAAAWMTPPVGIVALALAPVLWKQHRALLGFLSGTTLVTLAGFLVLAAQGALSPLMEQITWNRTHYGDANFVAYGSKIGGWGAFFDNAQGIEWIIRAGIVAGMLLPSLLPPIATSGWLRHRDRFPGILLAGGLALVVSTLPRIDSVHLMYVSPVFFAMTALLADSIRPRWARTTLAITANTVLAIFGLFLALQFAQLKPVTTAAGTIRAPHQDAAFVDFLNREIPRGGTLFVFPYKPIVYFLTGSTNPTRYSYFQPGMMGPDDESKVVAQLEHAPPDRMLIQDVPAEQILKIWPSTDPARLRYAKLENFLAQHYQTTATFPYPNAPFRVLQRLDYSTASEPPRITTLGR